MSEERIRKIFAERLKSYMEARGKQPVDLVNDLKLPFSTVSSWLNGIYGHWTLEQLREEIKKIEAPN